MIIAISDKDTDRANLQAKKDDLGTYTRLPELGEERRHQLATAPTSALKGEALASGTKNGTSKKKRQN